MKGDGREREVKFYLSDLRAFDRALESVGAELVHARTHEINLRFDTPAGSLAREDKVLRLRSDQTASLTFKAPDENGEGEVLVRREIEVQVADFERARDLLEALGYEVAVVYEKYRTVFGFQNLEVTRDEMPFGAFTELEGPDDASIRSAARALGLGWEARIHESYLALFDRVREQLNLSFRDLTFENFQALEVSAQDLGVPSGQGG